MKFMVSYNTKISLRFDYAQPRKKENNQHIVSFHSVQVSSYEEKPVFYVIFVSSAS